MKAMLVDREKRLVWSEVPDPVPKKGEVLVRICAAGVNRADLLQREGRYPSPPGCPEWMGLEIAGVVEKTGEEETRWKPGDRVCALLGGGGYAEYAVVRRDMLMPVPKGLSLIEAASLPEAYATSYLNLFLEGRLSAGQTAFIPAGGSGLASAAIPLAKAFGARVVTSVRSAGTAEKIRSLGADVIVDLAREKVEDALKREEEAGTPVSVSMDCLAGETLGKSLPYMAPGGTWIVISTLAGTETSLNLRPLLTKGLRLAGSRLRGRTPEEKACILAELVKNVWPKLEDGTLKPGVTAVFPVARAEEAHAVLRRGGHVGKVVLTVGEEE